MENRIHCVNVGVIETNCWLYPLDDNTAETSTELREERHSSSVKRPCIVIDPGDEAPLIISCLKENNWIPRYIFLTHGHFDHLAALPDLVEAFEKAAFGSEEPVYEPSEPACGKRPSLKVGIHRMDANYLGKDALQIHRKSITAAGGSAAFVDSLWKPLPEADILFEEGDYAGPFRIIHVPGHTQGSVGFYDEKAGVLFSGDTLFKGNRGRTDLPGGNEALIQQSLKRLLSMKGETTVCPGHGPVTTIGDEANKF